MRVFLCCSLLLVWVVPCFPLLAASSIVIAADRWCPYNCAPDSDKPGFMIEIAQQVFANQGIDVSYRLMPWNRAVQGARLGEFDAIVGAAKSDAPDFVFPAVEQGRMQTSFWANKTQPWRYRGIESLQGKVLGVSAGYSYGPELDKYIADPLNQLYIQVMYGSKPLEQGLRMLKAGRIDLMLEDESVLRHHLLTQTPAPSVTLADYVPLSRDFANVYVAFSPANPQAKNWAETLAKGTEKLRMTGELIQILDRYGLADWRRVD